ncbi:hypothetical protein D9M70_377740 [compost metagenome]
MPAYLTSHDQAIYKSAYEAISGFCSRVARNRNYLIGALVGAEAGSRSGRLALGLSIA